MGVGNILQVVLSLSLSCGRDAYCLMHYVLKKEFSEWIQDCNLTIFINDDILHLSTDLKSQVRLMRVFQVKSQVE